MAERRVNVVPYQDEWKGLYERESSKIAKVFVGLIVAIHHIGSTAISGMSAKPTIDILVEVNSFDGVNGKDGEMERLGYVPMGEYGIPGRRYYVKKNQTGEHSFMFICLSRGHRRLSGILLSGIISSRTRKTPLFTAG
ncbi:GrpB family protein [Terrilactibacillus sp. S3-3]|nr:GrpB family protein [Terrilactibacillus sp. S3-3]